MNYSSPTNIAVPARPGGEVFAQDPLARERHANADTSKLFAQAVSRFSRGLSLGSPLDNPDSVERLLA